jgi:hypothetical protein
MGWGIDSWIIHGRGSPSEPRFPTAVADEPFVQPAQFVLAKADRDFAFSLSSKITTIETHAELTAHPPKWRAEEITK